MPQLSLYLDDPSMDLLRSKSELAHVSMSKYVVELIRQSEQRGVWPSGYWDEVYGSIADPSFVAPPDLDPALDGSVSFDWL